MKKKGILFLAFFGALMLVAQTAKNLTEFKTSIKANKNEAKAAIKPFLYDGYKNTYFNYKTYKQTKEVEIYLFNNAEYRLAFNGKSCPKGLTVKIYNSHKSNPKRVLLKELTNVTGETVVISTNILNKIYKKSNKNASRLKRIFVNYVIPAVKDANNSKPTISDRGAAVLVIGYKG